MARFADVSDVEAWDRWIAAMKPGNAYGKARYKPVDGNEDLSLERREAERLWRRFGAVKDDGLDAGTWIVCWRDMGPAPTVRLSPDLFAHVADAAEAV